MKIKWNEFIIFLNLLILLNNPIFCYDTDSSASINIKSSAVIAGEDVIFTWENVEKYDIDPKITFWDYSSSPFIDKNFIEGSWSYLNEQSKLNQSTANPSGQVIIKAPIEEGLFKIYYCYTRYGEFKCNYIRTLAVITCGANNFQKMKQIIDHGKHAHKSNGNQNKNKSFSKHRNSSSSTNNSSTDSEIVEGPANENINKNNEKKISEIDFKQSILKLSLSKKEASNLKNNEKNSNNKKEKITQSNIEHIIIFISENHSFDSIYGRYCKAETNSNPTCNYGPECCEAAPSQLHGIKPFVLTDTQNSRYDPCHQSSCENSEISGGLMNKYMINGEGSHPYNFAVASESLFSAKHYYNFAKMGQFVIISSKVPLVLVIRIICTMLQLNLSFWIITIFHRIESLMGLNAFKKVIKISLLIMIPLLLIYLMLAKYPGLFMQKDLMNSQIAINAIHITTMPLMILSLIFLLLPKVKLHLLILETMKI